MVALGGGAFFRCDIFTLKRDTAGEFCRHTTVCFDFSPRLEGVRILEVTLKVSCFIDGCSHPRSCLLRVKSYAISTGYHG